MLWALYRLKTNDLSRSDSFIWIKFKVLKYVIVKYVLQSQHLFSDAHCWGPSVIFPHQMLQSCDRFYPRVLKLTSKGYVKYLTIIRRRRSEYCHCETISWKTFYGAILTRHWCGNRSTNLWHKTQQRYEIHV